MTNSVRVACALLVSVLVAVSSASQDTPVQASDFTNWSCINNAACINSLAVRLGRQLNGQQAVDLGLIRIQPIEPRTAVVEGRAMPSTSFFDRNAIQIPFLSWYVNFEPSESKTGFYQVSVSPKDEGRSVGEGRRKHKIRDRLRTRAMILPFLAMNAIGWLLFAIFAVKVLTVKAFLVAKLAFLLTSVMTMKKFLETAVQRAGPLINHPEFLPFNSVEVDGGFPQGSDIMPYHMPAGHNPFQNSLVAESNINAVVEANNATSAVVAAKAPAKIKRQDIVGNRKNLYYNYVAQRSPIYSYRQVY